MHIKLSEKCRQSPKATGYEKTGSLLEAGSTALFDMASSLRRKNAFEGGTTPPSLTKGF
jgi:hypothetical protein